MSCNHIEAAQRAIAFIRDNHKHTDVCVGYAWATLADIVQGAGLPRPVAPWSDALRKAAG